MFEKYPLGVYNDTFRLIGSFAYLLNLHLVFAMASNIILGIHPCTPTGDINLDEVLDNIEFEMRRYFSEGKEQLLLGSGVSGVNKDLNEIRDFVKEQQRIAKEKGTVDNIKNVGLLLTTILKSVEDLQSDDPHV